MKNVAYKKITNDPTHPDGFVKEYFATDQDAIEGYIVVPYEEFPKVMLENRRLLENHDPSRNPKPVVNAGQPVPPSDVPPANDTAAMFQKFLAWQASQNNNS